MEQQVILVNELDEPIGSMDKMEAHHLGVLHRAFSIFIFDSEKRMLLQQRSMEKYHSGGLWTNACCSHPKPGEETPKAAARRLKEELGFETPLLPLFWFTYKAEMENGLTEHEFDHVFFGTYDGPVKPNTQEIMNFRFENVSEIELQLQNDPGKFTAWFRIAFPEVLAFLKK